MEFILLSRDVCCFVHFLVPLLAPSTNGEIRRQVGSWRVNKTNLAVFLECDCLFFLFLLTAQSAKCFALFWQACVACQEGLYSSFYSTILSTVLLVVKFDVYLAWHLFFLIFLDIGGVHTENCVVLLVATFFLIAWSADRNPVKGSRTNPGRRAILLHKVFAGFLHQWKEFFN